MDLPDFALERSTCCQRDPLLFSCSAREIFRGTRTDVGVGPTALDDGDGHKALLIEREIGGFEAETYLVVQGKAVKLALPLKVRVRELVAGRLRHHGGRRREVVELSDHS